MTSRKAIAPFLDLKRIAVVGVSQKPNDFSRSLFHEFLQRGYDTVPVNPAAEEMEGQRCFGRVDQIQPPVEAVLLMTKPEVTDVVVRDCANAGVKHVWMYRATGQGAVSNDAVKFCESNGMSVIAGECPFMFLPGTSWFHRFHGVVRKIGGLYPK
jgi:predicted CoA-binding protein